MCVCVRVCVRACVRACGQPSYHPSRCCTLVVVEERPPPQMIVKRFGCTTIHNKALYKSIIHSFIQTKAPTKPAHDLEVNRCFMRLKFTRGWISSGLSSTRTVVTANCCIVQKQSSIWLIDEQTESRLALPSLGPLPEHLIINSHRNS